MTSLLMLGIVLFGVVGYHLLPISDLPNVDFPTVQVTANLPGASPAVMAATVATPLEQQFSNISGLTSMTSSSSQGLTQITLQFDLNRNLDGATIDVQSAITQAQRLLPQNLPNPPTFRKVNPSDQPILYIAMHSSTLPLYTVDDYAETQLAQQISMISGVAQVQIFGSQKYAVRVQSNPDTLAAYGIGIDQVVSAVERGNVNLATGTLDGFYKTAIVQAPGQLYHAKDYLPLIITYRDGAPVRLQQIGTAIDDVQNNKVASWYNGERSIILAVQRQPGSNTIQVINSIKKILPRFQSQLPAAVKMDILYDRSGPIRDSVKDVQKTLVLAGVLVVLVIFLFLRNLPATIIPAITLPITIIGTFGLMELWGFSLDNISLLALTLCVGFVIDDAIVMLENISRHIEMGESVWDATLRGSKEISFTIISMSLSLAAVFIPVLFMGGVVGRLFHEFGVTIVIAILISGFVSLTLTPMMCSLLLQPHNEQQRSKIYLRVEAYFERTLAWYKSSLHWVLDRAQMTLFISLAMIAIAVFLYIIVPKGFVPNQDINLVYAFTEGAQDTSFSAMVRYQQQIAAIVAKQPYVEAFMSSVGAGGPNSTENSGRVFMRLKPRSQRPDVNTIIQDLRQKTSNVPGIKLYIQSYPSVTIGGQLTKSQYQYTLQDTDPTLLYRWAPVLEQKLNQLPQLQDVTSDLQIQNPNVNVVVDRDKASALGIDLNKIQSTLANAYGSQQISTIYTDTNQYQVLSEVLPQYQMDADALSRLYVSTNNGRVAPLSTFSTITKTLGPLTVNHTNQLSSVTISFNLTPGVSLGDAVKLIEKTEGTLQFPPSIIRSFQGTAQTFQQSTGSLAALLLIAILVIYIVLGMLYESFVHPITILSGLPSAGIGAILTLMLFGSELNVYSFFGIIMLIGIVKKNAIMMIDFAINAQHQGKTPAQAIYEACIIRFRPIMMTTMAALLGALPIALGLGAGSESRRPLGLAVVGGLLVSQIITLYITPVIYVYLDGLQTRLQVWAKRKVQDLANMG